MGERVHRDTRNVGEGMEAWATGLALSSLRALGLGVWVCERVSSAHTSQFDVCGPEQV